MRQLLSVLVHLLSAGAVLAGLLFRQQWFGRGDLDAALFWTLPLAAGLAAGGDGLLAHVRRARRGWRPLATFALAVLLAGGWFYLVAGLLGPWMGTFSFPIFYPWLLGSAAQLLFLASRRARPTPPVGPQTRARRWRWVPVGTLGLGLALGLRAYLSRPWPETYLIPAGFEGPFRVVYGVPGGIRPAVEAGRQVLPVPANGILLLENAHRPGYFDHQYYLVNAAGTRRRVGTLPDYARRAAYAPGVLPQGGGALLEPLPNGGYSTGSPPTQYNDFLVVNHDTTTPGEATAGRQQQRFDSLMDVLVADARRRAGAR